VNEAFECLYADDDDLLRKYAAGKVTESEAERFEEHLFGCDRCRTELEQAMAIRAAMQEPSRASLLQWRFPSVAFVAAAAAVIVVVFGLLQLRSRDQVIVQPVRGAKHGELAATALVSGGSLSVNWNSIPGARDYTVQLFTADGSPLQSMRTSDSTASLPLGSLPSGAPLYWRVQAIDENGVVISSSPLQRIARPR
jgi:putative zinc finger protein